MTVAKRLLKHGVLLGVEAGGYGQGGALVGANDGFHTTETPDVQYDYLDNGEVAGTYAGSGGTMPRVGRSGRWGKVSLPHYLKTPGIAYSSSVKPTIHTPMRLAGHLATLTATGGSEKWTYTPQTEATFESGVGEFYDGSEKDPLKGIYCNAFEVGSDGLTVPRWMFELMGIGDDSSDASVPSITYPNEAQALLKAIAMTFKITLSAVDYTFILRKWKFRAEREITARTSQTSALGAHLGFQLGGRKVTCNVEWEAVARVGAPYHSAVALDPEKLADAGTVLQTQIQWGSVQYKRCKIAALQTQIANPKKTRDGKIRCWSADLIMSPSTPTADDDYSVTTD